MADFNESIRRLSSPKFRRGGSIAAFWILIAILAAEILQTYLVDGETQQSAYGDDWNDLGSFRSDINDMGIETNALVSSPLLLSEIDYPEEAVFVVSGVERVRPTVTDEMMLYYNRMEDLLTSGLQSVRRLPDSLAGIESV